jgi:Tol biopolymer transport system component
MTDGSKQARTRVRKMPFRGLTVLALGLVLAFFICYIAGGAGVTMRLSTDASGNQVDGYSTMPVLSADGGFTVFTSDAAGLVPGDANGNWDIFLKNTQTGAISRLSGDEGGYGASISADGRYIAFLGGSQIYVNDALTSTMTLASADMYGVEANSFTDGPAISSDGRYVAFHSLATNMAPEDTNGTMDVFVKDTRTGSVQIASADMYGNPGNSFSDLASVSGDGRYVAFQSIANNLVPGDTNGKWDVFVKDTLTGDIRIVSADADGNPGDDNSTGASISANGRYVAYESAASNLVPDDSNGVSDIFVKDVLNGDILLVSSDSTGNLVNGDSGAPAISADGRYVAFSSEADNLVTGDDNVYWDIFVKDTLMGAVTLVSTDPSGNEGDGDSFSAAISADGRFAAFESMAANVVPDDTNDMVDTFLAATSMASTSGKPSLELSKQTVYWQSYADYIARNLTVDLMVANTGANVAYSVQITGFSGNNGVSPVSDTPISLGNIDAGMSHLVTIRYHVPIGVYGFTAMLAGISQDGSGVAYSY